MTHKAKAAPLKVRMTASFRGRVQGVGFRYTACELAASIPVEGSVQNMPDGSVHLAAEGQRDSCEAFLEALRMRMGRFVTGLDVGWGEATGKEGGFRILR